MPSPSNFIPRSPDGERLTNGGIHCLRLKISIHAPRMGSDVVGGQKPFWSLRFQSTLPGWGATRGAIASMQFGVAFQSTLPGWGATRLFVFAVPATANFNPRSPDGERPRLTAVGYIIVYISIHAPRMGSDSMLGVQMLSGYDDFNPRSPDGERPGISISVVPEALISIHAPRMGSDVYVPRLRFVSRDFNPRSPDGERPIGRPYPRSLIYFNPRSPDGERQVNLSRIVTGGEFQSTLPGWGATEARPRHGPPDLFQSTLPGWGATSGLFHTVTPRSFQSTLPGWGATF